MEMIDRKALIEELRLREVCIKVRNKLYVSVNKVEKRINAQPAITERTAERRKIQSEGLWIMICGDCEAPVSKHYSFCSNCGAKFKEANHANVD